MKEFKGTKENWSTDYGVNINEYGVEFLSIDFDSASSCIDVYADMRIKDESKRREDLVANTNIIISSLDLLEALQDVLKLQEDNYGNGMNTHMRLKTLCDDKVRKAINKALD